MIRWSISKAWTPYQTSEEPDGAMPSGPQTAADSGRTPAASACSRSASNRSAEAVKNRVRFSWCDPEDLKRMVEGIRERFVEENRLAEPGRPAEVFKVERRIVDFKQQRVALCDRLVEIFGDGDSDTLQIGLSFVQPLPVLERGLEAETADGAEFRNPFRFRRRGILHQFREGDGVAGIQPDESDFDRFHVVSPVVSVSLRSMFFRSGGRGHSSSVRGSGFWR